MEQKIQLGKVIKNSFRLFFAPLTGAFKGVKSEVQRIESEYHKDENQHA